MTLCRNLGGNKQEARSTKDSDQSSLKSNPGQGIARPSALPQASCANGSNRKRPHGAQSNKKPPTQVGGTLARVLYHRPTLYFGGVLAPDAEVEAN